jgi:AraC-like DNA-binding protein
MNRVDVLLATPAVTLRRFDHPPGHSHVDPEWERADACSISVVEGGSFEVSKEGAQWHFAPGTIFVTTPGMHYSCTHDAEHPTDRCLSIAFSERTVEELRCADLPALHAPHASVTARQRYLRHRLSGCRDGDELRLELLAGAMYESIVAPDAARPVASAGLVSPLMRRIDRAVELIDADYAQPLTLDALAQAAGLSSFHFARTFRRLVGLPPHRYLSAVRLGHAARRLMGGASVTRTCYDVGFGSLSHFINAFRLRYGVSPSHVRRGRAIAPLRAALSAPIWRRAPG